MDIFDIDGKKLEIGQIVAVRYVWNSYLGVVRLGGLSLIELAKRFRGAAPYHSLDNKAHYQIVGHMDPDSAQFIPEVYDWATSEEDIPCPVELRIYDGLAEENKKFEEKHAMGKVQESVS